MSLLGTFSDFPVKCYGPSTNRNPKRWESKKSQYKPSRTKNPTFPTVAQNNVWFFLLPSTTTYWYVLQSKENQKIFKNEILNWNWTFSKLRGAHFRPNSAKKLYFGELLNIFIKVSQFHTYGVTYSPCRAANFEPSWDPQAQFVPKLQPFPRHTIFLIEHSKKFWKKLFLETYYNVEIFVFWYLCHCVICICICICIFICICICICICILLFLLLSASSLRGSGAVGFSAIWLVCFKFWLEWFKTICNEPPRCRHFQIGIIANTRKYTALRRKYTNTNTVSNTQIQFGSRNPLRSV